MLEQISHHRLQAIVGARLREDLEDDQSIRFHGEYFLGGENKLFREKSRRVPESWNGDERLVSYYIFNGG